MAVQFTDAGLLARASAWAATSEKARLRPYRNGRHLGENTLYRFGFTERMDSTASLLGALDSLKQGRVLP